MGAKEALTGAAAVFGALAAGLWLYASNVKVEDDPNDQSGKIINSIGGRRINVLETARVQTGWNARAAAAASIASACQVVLLWL